MASRIAEAYVQIVPRIDGIGSSLTKGLSGEMGKAGETSGQGFAAGFKKFLGPAVALAATAAIANFAKTSVLAAEEVATANARIAQINESMGLFGSATQTVTDRLIAYAEANEQTLATDGEVIKATQAKLLTFKELAATADTTGGAFDRATAAAVDLAAAGFGSAETNAVQLGKALNDPIKGITALARSGITFTEAEKEKIKVLTESGQILEAQNLVLAAIETQVGGTAAATANYSDRIKLAFDNLKETVGTALAPAFEQFAVALIPIVNQLGPVLAQIFTSLAPVLTTIAGVLPALASLFAALAPALDLVFQAVGSIIEAALPVFIQLLNELMPILTALLPPVVEIVKALLPIIPALLQIALAVIPLVQTLLPLLTQLIQFLTPIITFLAKVFTTVLKVAIDIVVGAMKIVIGIVQNVIKWFGDMVKAVMDTGKQVLNFFTQLPKTITQVLSGAGTWLFQIGKDIIDGLLNGLKSMWSNVTGFFSNLGKNVANSFKAILGIKSPSTVFYRFGENIVDGLVDGVMNVSGTYEEAMEKLGKIGANTFIATTTGAMMDLTSFMGSYSAAWNEDASKGQVTAGNAIRAVMGNASLQGVLDKLSGNVTVSKGNKMVSYLNEYIDGPLDQWLADMKAKGFKVEKQPKGTVDELIAQLGSIPIPKVRKPKNREKMARGGFVNGPTNALIGEYGPEVVVPLNKFEKWMGLGEGNGKVINYYAAENKSIDSEQALIQAIKRAKVITAW